MKNTTPTTADFGEKWKEEKVEEEPRLVWELKKMFRQILITSYHLAHLVKIDFTSR